MTIYFLTHYFPPERNAPANRVSALAKRWADAGHDVVVLTCAPNVPNGVVYQGYRNRLKPQVEKYGKVTVIRLWTYLAANKGAARRILNFLTYLFSAILVGACLRVPDRLIATSPQFFCGWAGVILKWIYLIKSGFRRSFSFILEIRDIWPESILAVGALKNSRLIRILEYLEQKMYRAADLVVTVGEGYRSKLLEKGVASEKIEMIMNGTEVPSEYPDQGTARSRYDVGNRFLCSYVGTVGMASGLQVLIRAAKKLKQMDCDEFRFLIVGDGAIRQELEVQSEQDGLNSLIFSGLLGKKEVAEILVDSDVCLVHLQAKKLFQTVIPSKIFEAMAYRKPILLGVKGEAAKIIAMAECGVEISPENEDDLVHALVAMKEDRQKLNMMAESGYHYFLEHNSWDALADRYLTLITTQSAA